MDSLAVRRQFSFPEDTIYLDTASYGPGPDTAREAIANWAAEWTGTSGAWRVWEELGERCREGFATLLGTSAERVALLPSLSSAAAQVGGLARAGRNVVVGAGEFRSNYMPFVMLRERGVEVREVGFRDGVPDFDALLAAIDDETDLVAVSHVQSASGWRVPLERLSEHARRHGALVFLDATQSAGALRIELEHVDLLGTAAYKWLLAPKGAAFLWVRDGLEERLTPLAPGWRGVHEPYAGYYGGPWRPAQGALRYDVALAWVVWAGLERSLALLVDQGQEPIEAHDLALANAFRDGLAGVGQVAPSPLPSPIVAVRLEPEAAASVAERLRDAGVRAAVRGDYLRFSFHLYNGEADVERALRAVHGAGPAAR